MTLFVETPVNGLVEAADLNSAVWLALEEHWATKQHIRVTRDGVVLLDVNSAGVSGNPTAAAEFWKILAAYAKLGE